MEKNNKKINRKYIELWWYVIWSEKKNVKLVWYICSGWIEYVKYYKFHYKNNIINWY